MPGTVVSILYQLLQSSQQLYAVNLISMLKLRKLRPRDREKQLI